MTAVTAERPRIDPSEVHVVAASLDVAAERLATLERHLSRDERARAARFRFPWDRDRFVAGRGLLRELLAEYVGAEPGAVRFAYGEHGRPSLAGGDVAFNASHSGPTALYAFAAEEPVGVDVEGAGAEALADRVPEHFFSPREVAELRALPPADQEAAFLRCWTRKEALLKAHGAGLLLPLHDFAVTLAPCAEPRLVWAAWSAHEPRAWRLHDISYVCQGHVAAVAVGAGVERVINRTTVSSVPPTAAGASKEEMR